MTFMDSSGIGVVLGRYKKIRAMGGTVAIRGAGSLVRQILEMSRGVSAGGLHGGTDR